VRADGALILSLPVRVVLGKPTATGYSPRLSSTVRPANPYRALNQKKKGKKEEGEAVRRKKHKSTSLTDRPASSPALNPKVRNTSFRQMVHPCFHRALKKRKMPALKLHYKNMTSAPPKTSAIAS